MSDRADSLEVIHHEYVGRYRRILQTYLTDSERRFVERRLAEEEAALAAAIDVEASAQTRSHAL